MYCAWNWSVECVLPSCTVSKMFCNIQYVIWEFILKINVLIQAMCTGFVAQIGTNFCYKAKYIIVGTTAERNAIVKFMLTVT